MQHVKVIDLPVIGIVFHCKHNQEPICSWQDFFPPEIRVGSTRGGGGSSHTLRIRFCAAQRGRDFEAPDLEWGVHFRGVF